MARLRLWLFSGLFAAGCTCAKLPDTAVFACEEDHTCRQAGFVCGADNLCRSTSTMVDAGLVDAGEELDAGEIDAGQVDAGEELDAGTADAGEVDAGFSDGGDPTDAGATDAGTTDAGPTPDAGVTDAGTTADAGPITDAGATADAGAPTDAGSTDAGGGDAGPQDAGCVPSADEPDQLGLDTNCDGVDGDLSRAAVVDTVNGNDTTGAGTIAAPYKTITRALQAAKAQTLVSEGTYPENLTFSAARIFGGYAATRAWARDGGAPVISGHVIVLGDGGALATDGGTIFIDALHINAPAVSSPPGSPSIALVMSAVGSGAIVQHSRLQAGTGAIGANGAPGTSGASSVVGGDGLSGDQGGTGGLGGIIACYPDGGPASAHGGNGGQGGFDIGNMFDGDAGDPPLGGPGGANTSCALAVTCAGLEGVPGGDGQPGSDGDAGSVGVAGGTLGSVVGLNWTPASAAAGSAGTPGIGGGAAGGGGAIWEVMGTFVMARGGGGGGGASGSCGGNGGLGGQGGGASIALLLINASPLLRDVQFVAAVGGKGGNGGAAGAPGTCTAQGGFGGLGERAFDVDGGMGGTGASGGCGGPGGVGGGGAGGPSFGLFCQASTPVLIAPTYTLPDAGALGGTPNGPANAVVLQKSASCP